jgi:hypothetical protein
MTVMQIETNIKKLTDEIEKMKIDVYRLEGSLKMLYALKESGVSEIDLPNVSENASEIPLPEVPEVPEVQEVPEVPEVQEVPEVPESNVVTQES